MSCQPISQETPAADTVKTYKHGYQDFDIDGHPTIHRACVPNGIRVGELFNVYHDESSKSGALWVGTLETSLRKFAAL